LVDHIQDGDLDELYTMRTVVVGGNTPYVTSVTLGSLPPGLGIDSPTGVLSGTPTAAGEFSFTISATDADAVQVTKAYTMIVAGAEPIGTATSTPDTPNATATVTATATAARRLSVTPLNLRHRDGFTHLHRDSFADRVCDGDGAVPAAPATATATAAS
jgi:hypothetical protein